ncbi:MAG TPA: isoprenylcysteine carboxylmethyltransferase family protein [Acidobacteriota bacterium]|jgi:protein-S-isoprenylcysteine O-methyltransferase Ste14|nr:isoprenylcysteine carboxylmethyltransferase family protein [Acidobacteriota bacterium]
MIAIVAIGTYHRARAARSREKISRKEEGKLIWLRLFGLCLWLAVIAYLINPEWMQWSALPSPRWLRWVGVGLAVLCVPLAYWVFSSLGKNVTDTVVTRKNHTLVTTGPYRWIRHPLYVVVLLLCISLSLLMSSWFIWMTAVPLIFYLVIRTPIEEAKLIERFGDQYRVYMDRTRRFFPRLGPRK